MRFLTSNRLRRELEKSNTIIADRFEKLITAIIMANPGETGVRIAHRWLGRYWSPYVEHAEEIPVGIVEESRCCSWAIR